MYSMRRAGQEDTIAGKKSGDDGKESQGCEHRLTADALMIHVVESQRCCQRRDTSDPIRRQKTRHVPSPVYPIDIGECLRESTQ